MSRAHGGVAGRRRPLIIGMAAAAVALVGLAVTPADAAPVLPRQTDNPCAGVVDEVRISGSTSAQIAISSWGSAICAEADAIADAINTGSKGGREAIVAGTAQIGLTSLPFTEEEEAALVTAERGVVMIPVLAGAAVCTYWDRSTVSDYPQGKGYPNLRMSRMTVGQMLAGRRYDTLGDGGTTPRGDDLRSDNAENPDYPRTTSRNLGTEFYVRSGYSALTYEVGRWVAQDADAVEAFDAESEQRYDAELPFEEMPNLASDQPRVVNDYAVMAKQMVEAPTALGVGCMDGATARTDARPENPGEEVLNLALLESTEGIYVAPTDAAVTAGVEAMVANGDGTFRPAVPVAPAAAPADAAGDEAVEEEVVAYPMPLVVYAAVPTCGFDAASRAATSRVLDYMVGPGQEALPPGNVPLVGEVAATSTRQLASWKQKVVERDCGEDEPGPTTTTTTTTLPGETTTTVPFVDPGFVDTSGGGSGGLGVVPDPGFDPGTGGGGGVTDPGVTTPAAEETAAGPPIAPLVPTEEEVGPVARIVAMARGSAALPPLVLIVGGLAFLVIGPVLQAADGLSRTTSLPSLVRRWFSRLRP